MRPPGILSDVKYSENNIHDIYRGLMINIDEDKLKLLLEYRKKKLEKPKYSGTGEIISGVSLAITLLLSDFKEINSINPWYFQIVAWIFTVGVTLYGLYSVWDSIRNSYTVEHLYSEISDLDSKIEHPFNIVLIKNSNESGKYLLFKSRRWTCWLFPNYRCLDGRFNHKNEIENIKRHLNIDLNVSGNIEIKYIGNTISHKFSFSDKIEKKYNFHFYVVTNMVLLNSKKSAFSFNGKKYCWKSLHQMYGSKNMIRKNKDVLDYVRNHCDMS